MERRDMHRIALHRAEGTEAGSVELLTLLVEFAGDYICVPPGILTLAQIRELCRQLRCFPPADSGVVGNFGWVRMQ